MAPIAVWTRFPWLFGYLVAPVAYYYVTSRQATFFWFWAAPLFTSHHAPAMVLAICWHFHFLRRAAEVVFLNVYHGQGIPNERDSVEALVYYLVWGLINGCTAACIAASVEDDGNDIMDDVWSNIITSCSPQVILGLIMFVIAQAGNYSCHAHLLSLRPDPKDPKWVIPHIFPFSILVAPHYSFELLGWAGYSLAAGLAPPTIVILILSTMSLHESSLKRKEKYTKMYKKDDGVSKKDGPDPASRWLLVPFIY